MKAVTYTFAFLGFAFLVIAIGDAIINHVHSLYDRPWIYCEFVCLFLCFLVQALFGRDETK